MTLQIEALGLGRRAGLSTQEKLRHRILENAFRPDFHPRALYS
jgi:hypothetical protein